VKGQLSGMRGVYLVAAELSRLGFIASPTSRSAVAADILVTDQACLRAFSVQVKTNSMAASFWLVGKNTPVSDTHVYVLVNLKSKGGGGPEYYVVPSAILKKLKIHHKYPKSEFYQVNRKDLADYQDGWDVFGDPRAEIHVEELSVSDQVTVKATTRTSAVAR
jgi:hypothetical protein